MAQASTERFSGGSPSKQRLPVVAQGLIGAAVLFAGLEVFSRLGLVNPKYLPPASTVLGNTLLLPFNGGFLLEVLATLQAWAVGLGLAILIAVPIGLVLGSSRVAYRASRTLVELLRPIPSVALIPLAILLFGQGLEMKVSLVVWASSWPILLNTIYGVHDVDPVAKDTARSFGFDRLAILARVSLPSAAPFVVTGVRVSAAIALIVTISAELLAGGDNGIGTWMLDQSAGGENLGLVYAATVFTGLMGLALNYGLERIEKRFFAWQPALRGDD